MSGSSNLPGAGPHAIRPTFSGIVFEYYIEHGRGGFMTELSKYSGVDSKALAKLRDAEGGALVHTVPVIGRAHKRYVPARHALRAVVRDLRQRLHESEGGEAGH